MQQQLVAWIAIRAINKQADSALPDAPVCLDIPRRRPLQQLIHAARQKFHGHSNLPSRARRRAVRSSPVHTDSAVDVAP
jgi:hypothetical protein